VRLYRMALDVLIVDDSQPFLDAARDLLEQQGLRVVGLASTSAEAMRRSAELRPDVVLIDIMLAGESGFELARQLSARDGAALILISTHSRAEFADPIAESPAAGFLPKSELSADAILRIVDGAPGASAH
jgi:two-component system, NarL family, nitrate/nitrite response regulator NarL